MGVYSCSSHNMDVGRLSFDPGIRMASPASIEDREWVVPNMSTMESLESSAQYSHPYGFDMFNPSMVCIIMWW